MKKLRIKVQNSKMLKGKFILKGADYAGFEFIDHKTISWTNEIFPMDPDTMRLNIPLLKVKTETYIMKVITANDLLQQH